MISFEPKLRPSLEKAREEKKSVALIRCKIQEGKFDQKLEIVTSKHTKVEFSPKKFKLDELHEEASPPVEISIENVLEMPVDQSIAVIGKVVRVQPAVAVTSKHHGKPLHKQDCTIRDKKGSIRIVLWQDNIDKLMEGKSYRIQNVLLRQYEGIKYLSFSESAVLQEIEDIGDVISDEDLQSCEDAQTAEGEIVAVLAVDMYTSCISCNGKVKNLNDVLGECMKCNAKVKLVCCSENASVKFVVKGPEKTWRLTAFGEQINAIIGDEQGDSVAEKMLLAPRMKYYFSNTNIVKAVHKL